MVGIWNERVNVAFDKFDYLRTAILIRNIKTLDFALFETETHKFIAADYIWSENNRGNFEGHDKVSGQHKFTWQPHGSQFTIKYSVPASERLRVVFVHLY